LTLSSVLAELSLRAPRDDAIAAMVRNTDDIWHANLRRLVESGKEQGCLAADLNAEAVSASIVAAVKGISLPTMAALHAARVDQVFGELQQILGL